jgi:TATA-box binding protein (TBP) (component of TFIID and TFIIIB)
MTPDSIIRILQSPVTALAYISSMAVINGARSTDQIKKTVKAGYFSILKVGFQPRRLLWSES